MMRIAFAGDSNLQVAGGRQECQQFDVVFGGIASRDVVALTFQAMALSVLGSKQCHLVTSEHVGEPCGEITVEVVITVDALQEMSV